MNLTTQTSTEAFIAAADAGVLQTHCIIENLEQYFHMLGEGKLRITPQGTFKRTTGKRIWLYREADGTPRGRAL